MKALTVNESISFQRYRDPKTALGMNYGKKPLTNTWKILEFIGNKGEEGASFTEIQHFIWTVLWRKSEESFWKKEDRYTENKKGEYKKSKAGIRSTRGIYSVGLIGHGYGHSQSYSGNEYKGILLMWCHKNAKGKWVLDRMPEPGENVR